MHTDLLWLVLLWLYHQFIRSPCDAFTHIIQGSIPGKDPNASEVNLKAMGKSDYT